MGRILGRRPAPSLVVSVIALVVAMGGTGYAALSLPKNSVGSRQLRVGAVTPSKVAKSTVALFRGQRGPQGASGPAGQPGSIGPAGPAGKTGTAGTAGPTGPAGATGKNGTNGATGATGANGTNGATGVTGANGTNGATNVVVRSNIGTDVSCNPGEVAVGGGVNPDNSTVTSSYPTPSSPSGTAVPTGWHGTEASNGNPNQFQPTVYVICASP